MQDLTVSILQTDLIWEDIPGNLKKLERQLEATEVSSDMIILPEVFNTGFPVDPLKFAERKDGITISWMAKIAKQHHCIVTGSLLTRLNSICFITQ